MKNHFIIIGTDEKGRFVSVEVVGTSIIKMNEWESQEQCECAGHAMAGTYGARGVISYF